MRHIANEVRCRVAIAGHQQRAIALHPHGLANHISVFANHSHEAPDRCTTIDPESSQLIDVELEQVLEAHKQIDHKLTSIN